MLRSAFCLSIFASAVATTLRRVTRGPETTKAGGQRPSCCGGGGVSNNPEKITTPTPSQLPVPGSPATPGPVNGGVNASDLTSTKAPAADLDSPAVVALKGSNFKKGVKICIPPEGKDGDPDWKKCNAATKKAMDGGNKCEDGCQEHFGPPFGRLRVRGTDGCGFNTCAFDGKGVSLRGMSWFWHNWSGHLWKPKFVADITRMYCATVARFAMGVGARGTPNGPALVKQLVAEAIRVGTYALVDWHVDGKEGPGDANEAKGFWKGVTGVFGNYPNVLYETWNEPAGIDLNKPPPPPGAFQGFKWNKEIKPWHKQMVAEIRKNSDNIISLGTPQWSHFPQFGQQDVYEWASW